MPKSWPESWMDELDIKPGDHVIAIITDEDEAALISQFVAQSMEQGEPCSIIANPTKLAELQQSIAEEGVDVDGSVADQKLSFVDPVPIGMKDDAFDIDLFLERMNAAAAQVGAGGIEHARNCGAMDWLQQVTDDMTDAVCLEARLNELYEAHPISGL